MMRTAVSQHVNLMIQLKLLMMLEFVEQADVEVVDEEAAGPMTETAAKGEELEHGSSLLVVVVAAATMTQILVEKRKEEEEEEERGEAREKKTVIQAEFHLAIASNCSILALTVLNSAVWRRESEP